MAVSVNQILANTLGLADPLGRVADDGRLGFNGRVNINGRPIRFAPNFDGVDDYGVLPYRAINPDGDNTYEFYSPNIDAGFKTIIAQNISTNSASREFQLYSNGSSLTVIRGGTTTLITSSLKPLTRYGLRQVGNTVDLLEGGLDGVVVASVTATNGTVREPTAQTVIGARGNGAGLFSTFFIGLQYNIRINGTLWPMADRNQAIQLPEPSGLGAELITPAVLENPFSKGAQWTYLGGGRWQYVGDGSLDRLVFLRDQDHPPSGLLEFEIESISSGGILATTFLVNTAYQFNSVGVKRIFYTQQASVGYLTFNRASGTVFSCIIKNISFKPLGTCNPMILVNVTSDRWQEVAQ